MTAPSSSASRVRVTKVAVGGLSGGGKSTASYLLASHLPSLFRPISVDDFYIQDNDDRRQRTTERVFVGSDEALEGWCNSYDDVRAVDFKRYQQAVEKAAELMESYASSSSYAYYYSREPVEKARKEGIQQPEREDLVSWSAFVANNAPYLLPYIVEKGSEQGSCSSSPGNTTTKDPLAFIDPDRLAREDSGAHHEAHDIACWYSTEGGITSSSRLGSEPHNGLQYLFLLCEGFVVLSYPSLVHCFDVYVHVECHVETSCLRRFLRVPRRRARQKATVATETKTDSSVDNGLQSSDAEIVPPCADELTSAHLMRVLCSTERINVLIARFLEDRRSRQREGHRLGALQWWLREMHVLQSQHEKAHPEKVYCPAIQRVEAAEEHQALWLSRSYFCFPTDEAWFDTHGSTFDLSFCEHFWGIDRWQQLEERLLRLIRFFLATENEKAAKKRAVDELEAACQLIPSSGFSPPLLWGGIETERIFTILYLLTYRVVEQYKLESAGFPSMDREAVEALLVHTARQLLRAYALFRLWYTYEVVYYGVLQLPVWVIGAAWSNECLSRIALSARVSDGRGKVVAQSADHCPFKETPTRLIRLWNEAPPEETLWWDRDSHPSFCYLLGNEKSEKQSGGDVRESQKDYLKAAVEDVVAQIWGCAVERKNASLTEK